MMQSKNKQEVMNKTSADASGTASTQGTPQDTYYYDSSYYYGSTSSSTSSKKMIAPIDCK
jgi:hypothetical protein